MSGTKDVDALVAEATRSRIVICGGPRAGKTTLGSRMTANGATVRATDDLIGTHEWSEASDEVSRWFDAPGPWVVEGVTAVRGLRKWLRRSTGAPCDVALLLDVTHIKLGHQAEYMRKGVVIIWNEIVDELRDRGVQVIVQRQANSSRSWVTQELLTEMAK